MPALRIRHRQNNRFPSRSERINLHAHKSDFLSTGQIRGRIDTPTPAHIVVDGERNTISAFPLSAFSSVFDFLSRLIDGRNLSRVGSLSRRENEEEEEGK